MQHQPREANDSRQPVIPPIKRFLFTLIIVAIPVFSLLLLEVGLRIAEYGGNLDLVIRKTIGRNEFFVINRSVAQRYFVQKGIVVPEPSEDMFQIKKSARTKRIFCLGESTMAGFPYELNATAPSFLDDRLSNVYPDHTIEVINVGLSAVGSFVVGDFLNDLVDYEPDLFVVYVGHNEFYGAYGVGSAVALTGTPWMTRLSLGLLKFKTFLLLRDAGAYIAGLFSRQPVSDKETLMGQMVRHEGIPLGNETYERAKRIYADNLNTLVDAARDWNIPIMFSTLVSNLKDHEPFHSDFSPATGLSDRGRWKMLVQQGDSLLSSGNTAKAATMFQSAIAIDSTNASALFRLGRALYAGGEFEQARESFVRAKDHDQLRFRATDEFQQILIEVCSKRSVPLARVDSAFDFNSEHGIPGNELFLEHLHPNVDGYFLMGKVWAEQIIKNDLLRIQSRGEVRGADDDSLYWRMSTLSRFDRLVGELRVKALKHQWPFTRTPERYVFKPTDDVERIVNKYIRKEIPWSEARYELAEAYAKQGRFELARNECLAVAKVIPFSYQPLLRIADYFRNEGKNEEAKNAYVRCYSIEENPYARLKLAIILLEEENAAMAAQQIETALDVEKRLNFPLPLPAATGARYLLGVAYAKLSRFTDAREQLNRSLAINPNNEDARDLLRQIERY